MQQFPRLKRVNQEISITVLYVSLIKIVIGGQFENRRRKTEKSLSECQKTTIKIVKLLIFNRQSNIPNFLKLIKIILRSSKIEFAAVVRF